MRQKIGLVALLATIMIISLQPSARATNTFDQAISLFNHGHYFDAVSFLYRVLEEHPSSPLAHYYLANALAKIKLHEQAIEEFQLCYRLDPYGELAKYCLSALKAYKTPVLRKEDDQAIMPSTISSSHSVGWAPTKNNQDLGALNQTKSIIRRQADFEKAKHQHMGEFWATGTIRQAELEARRISEEASLEIQRILQPAPIISTKGVMPGAIFDGEAAKARADELRKAAEEAARHVKLLAEARATQYRQWHKERQAAIEEVVSNLEYQLDAPASTSGVKLQTVGTDLYVRYYGFDRSHNGLPDVHPASVRIVGQKAESQNLDVDSKPDKPTPPTVTKSVTGKVL